MKRTDSSELLQTLTSPPHRFAPHGAVSPGAVYRPALPDADPPGAGGLEGPVGPTTYGRQRIEFDTVGGSEGDKFGGSGIVYIPGSSNCAEFLPFHPLNQLKCIDFAQLEDLGMT